MKSYWRWEDWGIIFDADGLLDGYSTSTIGTHTWKNVDQEAYKHLIKINGEYVGELSLGTEPRIVDTEGDGIPDGAEYIYIHSIGITNMSEITAILHSRDYDHDGLPDYYEYKSWKYYEKVKKTANKVSKYLMLNNLKDA